MNEHILVVDDDEFVLTGLEANLLAQGFRVSTALTAHAAMEALGRDKPDLVLCDLVLGDGSGFDLMKDIHRLDGEIQVILITGHGTVKSALEALRGGAADFLQKPASPEEVVHRVRSVLESAHLRRALAAERESQEEQRRIASQKTMRDERMLSAGLLAEGAARALRTMIAPLEEQLQTLGGILPPDERLSGPHREALSAVHHIANLAADLAFVGGAEESEKSAEDVRTLVDDLRRSPELAALLDAHHGLRCDIHGHGNLPTMELAAAPLRRGLLHLVEFCCGSAGAGGAVRIEFGLECPAHPGAESRKHGDCLCIVATDNGLPIAVEDLDRLFEPFYPVKMGRTSGGLGLAYLYRVVREHGGTVEVSSTAGKGTAFHISLPVNLHDRQEGPRAGGETILLVDDYEDHRTLAANLLAKQGFATVAADGATSALSLFEASLQEDSTTHIDAAVIDLVLGDEIDGVDVYRRIAEIQPRFKAVIASGFVDSARLQEARRLGVKRCILKPYTAESLAKALGEALDG